MSEHRDSVRCLRLIDENGRCVGELHGLSEGAGLWLHGPDPSKPMVAVFTLREQTAIGLYESTNPRGPMPLALLLSNGRPMLQLMDPADPSSIRLVDLLDLVNKVYDAPGDDVKQHKTVAVPPSPPSPG